MIANKQDNSFSELSHKCTVYKDCTDDMKNKRVENKKDLVTTPMILKALFQVLPGSMTWELHAFWAGTNRISRLLKIDNKYQKQFYFILSIEMTRLISMKKDIDLC